MRILKEKQQKRTKTRQGLDDFIFIFLEDVLLIILLRSLTAVDICKMTLGRKVSILSLNLL